MVFAINGFGRIGRAIFRIAFGSTQRCIIINEPKASTSDMCYFLKYDSLYGTFEADVYENENDTIVIKKGDFCITVKVYHYNDVNEFANHVPLDCIIVESNGQAKHIQYYKMNPNRRVIFTFSDKAIDDEIILGVNEESIRNQKNNIVSGSICDTIAIAPILKVVYSVSSVDYTLITTMHPVLSYQNVIDNYIECTQNRSLGRQYIDSIIPKRTSAERILKKFFPLQSIRCLSYRIPTESVCSADITIVCNKEIDKKIITKELKKCPYVVFSKDDLISIDFKSTSASAVVDLRWLEVLDNRILKMMIWYDNEYGYSSRILDLMEYYYEG